MMTSLLLAWALMAAPSRPYTAGLAVEGPQAYSEVIAVKEPRDGVSSMVWTPESGGLWVMGNEGGAVYLLDGGSGAVLRRIALPDHEELDQLTLSADGTTLAAITSEAKILILDVASGRIQQRTPRHRDALKGPLAFSPDGKLLFGGLIGVGPVTEKVWVQAWDVATGKSRGIRRLREFSDEAEGFVPSELAGQHFYTNLDVLIVRPRPIQLCDDLEPYAAAGALGWYGDEAGGLRRLDDCSVIHARSLRLDAAQPSDFRLTADGARAAFMIGGTDTASFGMIDLATDSEPVGRIHLEVASFPDLALAPDGTQLAISLAQRDPDGSRREALILWRPFAAPGAPARRLELHMQ